MQKIAAVAVSSLLEVNEFVRRVMALNFGQAIWIRAEVAESNLSKGHFFVDLIEKSLETGEIVAAAQAIVWASAVRKIEIDLGFGSLETLLKAGLEIKIRARPEFNERFGLRLLIEEIDTEFGLGQLEIERRRVFERLQKERLLYRNAALGLPRVIQKIAVLTSETAAGWADFEAHLLENAFGFRFDLALFPTSVQGLAAEKQIIEQLEKVVARAADFDCAVIIRGGGSRLDLAVFDQLDLCRKVATMPLPILVGVGHETDHSALDLVAAESLKTPTAVADFLINRMAAFESETLFFASQIQNAAANALKMNELRVVGLENQLKSTARERFSRAEFFLTKTESELPLFIKNFFKKRAAELLQIEALASAFDPQKALKRGFTITRNSNGKAVRSASEIKKGERLETQFFDGSVESFAEDFAKNT